MTQLDFCAKIKESSAWNGLKKVFSLSQAQLTLLEKYLGFLLYTNQKMNLTAILSIDDAVKLHIIDSLMVMKVSSFKKSGVVADVGAGGGLPGIPIAIACPKIRLISIEVIKKKALFLQETFDLLGIADRCRVDTRDWMTFIRMGNTPVNTFVARASLPPSDLVAIFGKKSFYKSSKLFYWASKGWAPQAQERRHVAGEFAYEVAQRERRIITLVK